MDEDCRHGNGSDAMVSPPAETGGEKVCMPDAGGAVTSLEQVYILLSRKFDDGIEQLKRHGDQSVDRVNRHTDYVAEKTVLRLFTRMDATDEELSPLEQRVNQVLAHLAAWCETDEKTLPFVQNTLCHLLQSGTLTVEGTAVIIADRQLPRLIEDIMPYLRRDRKWRLLQEADYLPQVKKLASWLASWLCVRDRQRGTAVPIKANTAYQTAKRITEKWRR